MPLKDKWVDKINDLDYIDANDINEIAHSVIDVEKKSVENVLYTPQTLTDEQKAQARENIGAASEGYVLTETDKDEIKEAVKAEVPLIKTPEQPTFVNSVEECTDPEKIYVLPDGYMYAHGTKYVKQYTNLLPTLTDVDGSIYNGVGCKDNVRIAWDTGLETDNVDFFSTGFIPLTVEDTLRIRGVKWHDTWGDDLVVLYDNTKTRIDSTNSKSSYFVKDENGDVVSSTKFTNTNMAYVRFSFYVAGATPDFSSIIITVNEEIIEGEVEGFHNTGLVYQPIDYEDRIIKLEDGVAELKEEVDEIKETGGGGNVTFDYTAYGLPELALTGDVSAMTKDNAVTLDYVYGDKTGTCTVKWQGSSSLAYPKKNYTIKFDNAFEAVDGWGEQKKYCLKANYIDHSHARNVVSCKLWGQIVKSRANANGKLTALPNSGAIDGFPCVITINGEYQGLYTFNIPKDGWMFGMGETETEAIICGAGNDASAFREEFTADTIDLEYAPDENNADWVLTSLNRLINACLNSDGTDLDTTVAKYLDWDSAIDYYIFITLLGAKDMEYKNYLLATYDGTKWFFSAYDCDSTYGLYWNGKYFTGATEPPHFGATWQKALDLVRVYKKDELKARYAELRASVMSDANVILEFSNFVCQIPERIYLSDTEVWSGIPSSAASNLAQIVSWYQTRAKFIDAQMEAL